jgi:hypothetical protein
MQETKMKYAISLLLGLCVINSGCNYFERKPPTIEKAINIIVFCDLSSSLSESDSTKIIETAADAVNIMKTGTKSHNREVRIEYYSVPWGDRVSDRIAEYQYVPEKRESDSKKNYRREISNLSTTRQRIADSLKQANKLFTKNRYTCLMTSLRQAKSIFQKFDNKNSAFELVYVSDMLESCTFTNVTENCSSRSDTPKIDKIVLEKNSIADEIAIVENYECSDIDRSSEINVSIILPPISIGENTSIARPAENSLARFWKAAFRLYGFTVDDKEKYSFGYNYPARFK